jgi:hypothetical protein
MLAFNIQVPGAVLEVRKGAAAANRRCKLHCSGLTPGLSSALLEAGPFTPFEILVNLLKPTPPGTVASLIGLTPFRGFHQQRV